MRRDADARRDSGIDLVTRYEGMGEGWRRESRMEEVQQSRGEEGVICAHYDE